MKRNAVERKDLSLGLQKCPSVERLVTSAAPLPRFLLNTRGFAKPCSISLKQHGTWRCGYRKTRRPGPLHSHFSTIQLCKAACALGIGPAPALLTCAQEKGSCRSPSACTTPPIKTAFCTLVSDCQSASNRNPGGWQRGGTKGYSSMGLLP